MDLIGGGVDSRGGYVSKILYVKTKELGPLGGRAPGAPPLDPPMHRHTHTHTTKTLALAINQPIKLCTFFVLYGIEQGNIN